MKKYEPGFQKVLLRPMLCLSVGEVVTQMHADYKLIAAVVLTES